MDALTPNQLDVLQELINIGVGHAANTLNQMSGQHVSLHAPEVTVVPIEKMLSGVFIDADQQVMAIKLSFSGNFSGMASLMFPPESANKLITIILGEEPVAEDMDMMRVGVLQEVGNIVLNGVMGSIGNLLMEHIDYLPPDYYETSFADLLTSEDQKENMLLLAKTNFFLEERLIQGDILVIFRLQTFDSLLTALNRMMAEQGMSPNG
ncbi:chemotaxis protein CheC [Desulfonatronum thioautotrophicum]|uniref:chemotaxis protein CheC n=1 Tax=Desulfonatronum thioautotrophicum TaxID=617001 RepID=UPI0005EB25B3|nr:chemotaxis protein CheC [Desulfonatronum thioautotrophicum]